MLLVVTYHYIRETGTGMGIYPVTPANFEKQLDLLGEHFRFVSIAELIEMKSSNPGGDISENLCLITFDDGLREQYETAWPILRKRRIPALFFICTGPLADGQLLTVHKIQHIRSRVNHAEIERSLAEFFKDRYLQELKNIDRNIIKKTYRYDSEDEAYLKYLLNYVLNESDVDKFISYLYKKYIGKKGEDAAFYLTEKQIIEMSRYGAVGSHTVSHRPLSKLRIKDAVRELSESKKTLETLTSREIPAIAYPYGGPSAVTGEVAEAAQKAGYEIGFTAEASFNRSLTEPLLWARADTNDVIGGKSPRFDFVDGRVNITGSFSPGRRKWVTESIAE